MSMVLIDLPNFFNGLVAESSVGPELTKAYFLDWLDLELMASILNPDSVEGSSIGTWVFYSDRAMGRGAARLSAEELREFVKRHNRITGISAMPVDIPGEQGESFKFACLKCGAENETQTLSEKGIDSTLITHLFDTMEHWRTATIVSQDVDYCPAVRALRKRGKLVYGAGFVKRAGDALIRECFGYIDVMDVYIRGDLDLFLLFRRGGRLSQLYKCASGIDGVKVSSGMSSKGVYGETGGWWGIGVELSGKDEISPDKESLLIEQGEAIKREFPFVILQTKHIGRSLIDISLALKFRQFGSLRRAKDRCLDFEVTGP
jgi:hypothetical protein